MCGWGGGGGGWEESNSAFSTRQYIKHEGQKHRLHKIVLFFFIVFAAKHVDKLNRTENLAINKAGKAVAV